MLLQFEALEVCQAQITAALMYSARTFQRSCCCWQICEPDFLLLPGPAAQPARGSSPRRGGCHNLSASGKRWEELPYRERVLFSCISSRCGIPRASLSAEHGNGNCDRICKCLGGFLVPPLGFMYPCILMPYVTQTTPWYECGEENPTNQNQTLPHFCL